MEIDTSSQMKFNYESFEAIALKCIVAQSKYMSLSKAFNTQEIIHDFVCDMNIIEMISLSNVLWSSLY